MVNTQTRASIGGCIGFFSDKDGRFLVNVPDGVYDVSFGYANRGVMVAKDMKVFQDVDLVKVIIRP